MNERIIKQVEEERDKLGISVAQLCGMANISSRSYFNLLAGKNITLSLLNKIGNVLGMEIAYVAKEKR